MSTEAAAANKYAALVLDANTGKILHSRHADAKRYPASLTKMMTLYVVFDMLKSKRLTLDSTLLITRRAASQQPSKLGIKAGRRIKLEEAIRSLVTKSANDVAVAVAENLAGTEAKFARYMTWRARQIGMLHTTFKNASGLTSKGQLTTARDMATLGLRLSQDHPKLFRYFKTKYFRYGKKRYKNHNSLLFNFEGTEGIKTGYTRASGFNLVTSVRRGRRHVIAVVMGGKTARRRDSAMRKLLRSHIKHASKNKTLKPKPSTLLVAKAAPRAAKSDGQVVAQRRVRKIQVRKFAGLSKAEPTRVTKAVPSPVAATNAAASSVAEGSANVGGSYHVQVGSHASEASARKHLQDILRRAGDTLENRAPITMVFDHNDKRWYRARFSGFSRSEARAACSSLKDRKIDCIVMAGK